MAETPDKTEVIYFHNWLYSVVPADYSEWTSSTGGYEQRMGIFLVGYCRNCSKSFTVRLNSWAAAGDVRVDSLDIPKTGCVGPEAV